jgi:hypothetical protein
MAKKAQSQKIPFVIRPAKNGLSWYVFFVTGHATKVYEFASEKAAQGWINYDSRAWLRKRKAARRS